MHVPLQLSASACQLRPAAATRTLTRIGSPCNKALDVHCQHALCCPIGGGPTRRHNAIRDAIAGWLRDHGHQALMEQTLPEWESSQHGAAVLDVVYFAGLHGRTCLDITLVDTSAVAGSNGGRPYVSTLQRRERMKHLRYPHPGLVPFVLDVNGRWGQEAETWLRRVLGDLPEAERNEARCSLRAAVARGLHSQVAEQVAHATEQA